MSPYEQFLREVAEELRGTMVVTRTVAQLSSAVPAEWTKAAQRGPIFADAVLWKLKADAAECGMAMYFRSIDGEDLACFAGPISSEKIAEILTEAKGRIKLATAVEEWRQGEVNHST